MTKTQRVQDFCDFLRHEGYGPRLDDDGDIVFKKEGRTYVVVLDDDDPECFRILFPGFWKIESSEEAEHVVLAGMKATRETKAAKVYVVRDNACASVEMFCSSPEEPKRVFERCMGAIVTAVNKFVEEMRG